MSIKLDLCPMAGGKIWLEKMGRHNLQSVRGANELPQFAA